VGLASVSPGLEVRNLPVGKHFIVQNLRLLGGNAAGSAPATAGLVLRNNLSHVRVQGCDLRGGLGGPGQQNGAPGLEMINSISAALIDCQAKGGDGNDAGPAGAGGPGAIAGGGQLLVSQSDLTGGAGGPDFDGGFGGQGGIGLQLVSGSLLVVGSSPSGGPGGWGFAGGDGGAGLFIQSGTGWLLGGSSASGGNGGFGENLPNGKQGADIAAPTGAVTNFGGTQRGFDLTSPIREGQVGTLQLDGQVHEQALIFLSLTLHQLPLSGYQGVLMLSPTELLGPFVVGPPGNQALPFVGPTLPPGVDVLTLFVQPAYASGSGVILGTGRVLTLLDFTF
jgi:hypothetical protein